MCKLMGRVLSRLAVLAMVLALPGVAEGQFSYTNNNGAISITGYTGPGGAVVIPSSANGLPVTSIGDRAFLGAGLTSVTIPNSVTSIGYEAFAGCAGLTNVTIPNSVITIGEVAFSGAGLTSVTIPNSVANIGGYAFYGCTRLTSVTIPNGITNIGEETFTECDSLVNVTIGTNVTSIGDGAFSYCGKLTGVYFQGNAPSFRSGVFSADNSDRLTVYYLPGTTGWQPSWSQLLGAVIREWNVQVQTRDASFGLRTNQFGFTITGTSNLVIVVEASTNLANPNWYPLRTNTLNGNSLYFGDPQGADYPARFYRLRWP